MSRSILIVDDNLVDRTVLKGFLEDEYNIIQAQSGEEAIELIKKNFRYLSAIVLDIIMPKMDGYETLEKIKTNATWLQIPVIIITSMDEENSREKAVVLGADSFVTKPYNRVLLLHVIKNAIKLRESAAVANSLRYDNLTGLLNKDAFFSEAEQMIKQHEPGYYMLSCFDVEHFKVINDQYGIEVGDKVLIHIANSIKQFFESANGLSCHYTSDKFGILYPAKMKDTLELAENNEVTIRPDCINHTLKIRIGRCLVDDFSLSVSAMFDRASMAQETIKGRYDTYIADYDSSMMDQIRKEQEIVTTMKGGILNGEFKIWLQPQYNHATGALIGAEALVRWNKKDKLISPAEFVPVFERNGFIYEMDQNIWEQVCALIRKWLNEGKSPLPVSVNISRRDLLHNNFISKLTGIVDKYKLPYELVRLEVTESAFAASPIIEKVNKLIDLGFALEIDDFGSGYSSLNTLKDVPASILKLDMKFFEKTKNSQRSENIVESIVRMAHCLGMSVIAEGVESKDQADYLKSIGCYYIQGYLYNKPMPVSAYEKLFDSDVKHHEMTTLKKSEILDNNELWNPKSIETLIFNRYIGGACIFEFYNNKIELLRMNDMYIHEMRCFVSPGTQLVDASVSRFVDDANRLKLHTMIKTAIETKEKSPCELTLSDGVQTKYISMTCCVISKTSDRYLCYGLVKNITDE